jgi:isopentenyl diphosphate isomerase/L-lactate dehydrogenase-like FMN-dependent dehydrogenase
MPSPEPSAARKADHLRIAASSGVEHTGGTGLEALRLRHRALPARDLTDVDLATTLLGRRLAGPLVVSAMTGGTEEAAAINAHLLQAAADHGVAEGEATFSGVLEAIAATVTRVAPLPVLVKEVGFGLAGKDVRELAGAGVAAVDVAGAGGTNWALIEGGRDANAGSVAAAFAGWGTPTVVALKAAREAAPELPVVASGRLRDGVDVAKCMALGAVACGLARPFLVAAQADDTGDALGTVLTQLRIATWAAGEATPGALLVEAAPA